MSALRTAKKTFLQNLSSLVRTPRKFWSAYYSLRPNRQRIPVHLSNGPVTAESVQNKCDLLNSFLLLPSLTLCLCLLKLSQPKVFRPSSSTQEALISATTDWHKLLDSKANVAAVFFDLSKAFDSIPHSGILNALSGVGISGSLHQWFTSYLSNRCKCVVLDGCYSTPANVSSGVPQGSILGPLLFILYMDSITLVQLSPDTKILLYADDILLYSPIYQSSGISIFQSDVDSFSVGLSIRFQTQCCQNQACFIP